ncbi:MAG TPA: hypothetical protein V6D33_11665 [Cyanophyceae cyanobacterium]
MSCADGCVSPQEIEKVFCSWNVTPEDPSWEKEINKFISLYPRRKHHLIKAVIEELKPKLVFPRITEGRIPVKPENCGWRTSYFVDREEDIIWQKVSLKLFEW